MIAALTNAAIVAALATGFAHNVFAGPVVLAVIALFIGGAVLRERMALSGLAKGVVPVRALLITGAVASMYGVPTPHVECWDIEEPNAFAHGQPGKAVVVYTRGLLELLDDEQLEAVAAHEIAHVVNGDSRVGTLSSPCFPGLE